MWLGKVAPQRQSQEPLWLMNLFPTLAEASGARVSQPIDRESFLPILPGTSQTLTPERPLFFIRREGGSEYNGKTIDAIRLGEWKLLQDSPYSPLELYNLKDDPQEKSNQANERPEEFRWLEKLMREHTRQGGAIPWQKRTDQVRVCWYASAQSRSNGMFVDKIDLNPLPLLFPGPKEC